MQFDGRASSLQIQKLLKDKLTELRVRPSLAIICIPDHPSIISFIKIKKKYGEALGITVDVFEYEETISESTLVNEINTIVHSKKYTGVIVQIPLPKHIHQENVLSCIPEYLDVDVLNPVTFTHFKEHGFPIPPVAGAIAHILAESKVILENKKVVIVGYGQLVGIPTTLWFNHQGVTPDIIDIHTNEETKWKLLKEADIVITGIGSPNYFKKEHFQKDVILIDAGTSEQSGTLAGDIDKECAQDAYLYTPVPGGVGPLTVACLFKNLIDFVKQN